MDRALILKLIDEVLKETNAHTCCQNGVCTDHLCVVHNKEGVRNIVSSGADRISAGVGVGTLEFDPALARMIDHTLLKPDATKQQVEQLCAEAKQYGFASVCVNPYWVTLANQKLAPAIQYVLSNTDGPFMELFRKLTDMKK